MFYHCILILFNFIITCESVYSQNLNESYFNKKYFDKRSPILSRKKRFLIFPEGSSVQIVFCLTYPTIFNIGEIFLLGNTAALAWELPQDPYSPYRHHADPLHRRKDTKTIYFTDEYGRVLFKNVRKPMQNPAFAKRSVNFTSKDDTAAANAVASKKVTKYEKNKAYYNNNSKHEIPEEQDFMELMDERDRHFQRISRVELYEKLEHLLKALGTDGRQCVLNSLCNIGQNKKQSYGTFLEEIVHAIFRLPKGEEFVLEHHREYDLAHHSTQSCDNLYPGCNTLTLNPTTPIFSY